MAVRKKRRRKARVKLPSAPSPTARKIRLPYPKDADGNPLCRWCRGAVEAPRLSWCSDKCVGEYRDRYDNRHQRRMVLKRDRGVCQSCALDTLKVHRAVMARKGDRAAQLQVLLAAGFRESDLRFKRRGLRPLWQADHPVAVVEGGGGAHFSSLRSLCLICHRAETAELMKRRRALKKGLALLGAPKGQPVPPQ